MAAIAKLTGEKGCSSFAAMVCRSSNSLISSQYTQFCCCWCDRQQRLREYWPRQQRLVFYKATWLVLLAAVAAGPYSASELYNIVYIAVDVWFDAVWLLAVLEIHTTLVCRTTVLENHRGLTGS